MRLIHSEIEGIKFYHREGFSDLKTFEEVLGAKGLSEKRYDNRQRGTLDGLRRQRRGFYSSCLLDGRKGYCLRARPAQLQND